MGIIKNLYINIYKKVRNHDLGVGSNKRLHKNNRIRKSFSDVYHGGIAFKLIISFLIPVAFVIVIGIVSYQKASSAIINNYEKASFQSIKMTSKYMDFGLSTFEEKAIQYITDGDISQYLNGISDRTEANKVLNKIYDKLSKEQREAKLITNVHILSSGAKPITTAKKSTDNMYLSFLDTAGGEKLAEKSNARYWIGSDTYLDESFGVNEDSYGIRYVSGFMHSNSCIIFDISASSLLNIIKELDFGNGSITGLVTEDGRELISETDQTVSEAVFSKEDFFKYLINSNEDSISKKVEYSGERYLFIGSKVGNTGSVICSLIPYSIIIKQVNGIKYLSIILVSLSCVIAVMIGIAMASGINRVIYYIINELDKVSCGDLSVNLQVKNKDEFYVLANGINSTIDNMRELIEKVKKQSRSVKATSDKIVSESAIFAMSTNDITQAISEIQVGTTQQAEDSESCLMQMDKLSEKICGVSIETNEIKKITDATKESSISGLASMVALKEKARETSNITLCIKNDIEDLESKTKSIGNIIKSINGIASQTTLLALNASIEAARAGDAGRGFTVVAEEIRKLADQSIRAVKEMEEIIKQIQLQTSSTVLIANKADHIISEQEIAVNHTESSLLNLSKNVEGLIQNVERIADNINNMNTARVGTLNAIENISAVSQETAAAAISVYETTSEQIDSVKVLNRLSKELDDNAFALEQAVLQFNTIK